MGEVENEEADDDMEEDSDGTDYENNGKDIKEKDSESLSTFEKNQEKVLRKSTLQHTAIIKEECKFCVPFSYAKLFCCSYFLKKWSMYFF